MDRLAGLREETRKLALHRFHLLRPHLEGNQPLRLVAAAAGMPFRTAQRWAALYRQFGLTALVRRKRVDLGEHRFPYRFGELSAEILRVELRKSGNPRLIGAEVQLEPEMASSGEKRRPSERQYRFVAQARRRVGRARTAVADGLRSTRLF